MKILTLQEIIKPAVPDKKKPYNTNLEKLQNHEKLKLHSL